jgi:hypothetical protein
VLDAPFAAHGNVATAGGCLAAPYLAAWMIARGASVDHAREALHYVAAVGEKDAYVKHALGAVERNSRRLDIGPFGQSRDLNERPVLDSAGAA